MSYFNMVCDSCGREVYNCNIVNGMKFCAKCYQETFGNQQNKESNELLVNSLAEKDRKITELQKQLEEKEKTIQGLIEAQKYLEESASYQMFLDIQKQLAEKEKIEYTDTINFVETSEPDIVAKELDRLNEQLEEKDKEIKKLKTALGQASIEAFGKKESFVSSNYPKKIANANEYMEFLIYIASKEKQNANEFI